MKRAIDDWRFTKRMPSRASAIRELLRCGLAVEKGEISPNGVKSKDYGVIGNGAKPAPRKPTRSSTTPK